MAKGEHIQARRMHGLYYHHGIDMGDGTVIHFSGEPLNRKQARVCRISEESFLDGAPKAVVNYSHPNKVLSVEETLRLAEEQLDSVGYNLLYNNCEHFATYCKTGKKRSRQVRRFAGKAAAIAGTATAVLIVILTNKPNKRRA